MNNKKILFTLLKKIEKHKIQTIEVKLKNLYLSKNQLNLQLNTLINYKKEYTRTLKKYLQSGIYCYCWSNYNRFIGALSNVITINRNDIKKRNKKIENILTYWRQHQKNFKIWNNLHSKINNDELIKKMIQENFIYDEYATLQNLKKRKI